MAHESCKSLDGGVNVPTYPLSHCGRSWLYSYVPYGYRMKILFCTVYNNLPEPVFIVHVNFSWPFKGLSKQYFKTDFIGNISNELRYS